MISALKRYDQVWQRHDYPGHQAGRILVYDRVMKMEVGEGEIRLFTRDDEMVVRDVTDVAFSAFDCPVNYWVRVSHGETVWYLANGAVFGWYGRLGGTKRMALDVAAAFGLEVNFDAGETRHYFG
jgi:hypothetical protein